MACNSSGEDCQQNRHLDGPLLNSSIIASFISLCIISSYRSLQGFVVRATSLQFISLIPSVDILPTLTIRLLYLAHASSNQACDDFEANLSRY